MDNGGNHRPQPLPSEQSASPPYKLRDLSIKNVPDTGINQGQAGSGLKKGKNANEGGSSDEDEQEPSSSSSSCSIPAPADEDAPYLLFALVMRLLGTAASTSAGSGLKKEKNANEGGSSDEDEQEPFSSSSSCSILAPADEDAPYFLFGTVVGNQSTHTKDMKKLKKEAEPKKMMEKVSVRHSSDDSSQSVSKKISLPEIMSAIEERGGLHRSIDIKSLIICLQLLLLIRSKKTYNHRPTSEQNLVPGILDLHCLLDVLEKEGPRAVIELLRTILKAGVASEGSEGEDNEMCYVIKNLNAMLDCHTEEETAGSGDSHTLVSDSLKWGITLGEQVLIEKSRSCWCALSSEARQNLLCVPVSELQTHMGRCSKDVLDVFCESLACALTYETLVCYKCFACNREFKAADDFYGHFGEDHLALVSDQAIALILESSIDEEEERELPHSQEILEGVLLKENLDYMILQFSVHDVAGSSHSPVSTCDVHPDEVIQRILNCKLQHNIREWIDMSEAKSRKGRLLLSMLESLSGNSGNSQKSLNNVAKKLDKQIEKQLKQHGVWSFGSLKDAGLIVLDQNPFAVYDYQKVMCTLLKWYIKAHLEEVAHQTAASQMNGSYGDTD